ncbi:MAG: ABC transporter substrate-binding protein [Spirochaetes bacterium]|nr:ABC transporter substrate-binding protein [Spirochaetota bacterium]
MLKENSTRIFSIIISLAIVLFSFGSCGKKAAVNVDEWHIPVIVFLSGPFAGNGAVHKWMLDHVAEEINESGGINGKPVVLEYRDTAMDPSKAAAAMGKAVDMNSLCTLGPLTDMECKAAMPVAVREKMFAFTGGGGVDLAKQFFPWMVYIMQDDEEIKKHSVLQWVKQEKEIKHVVHFVEPLFPSVIDFAKGSAKSLEKVGVKSTIIETPVMKVDYSPSVVKALASGADGFAFWSSQTTSAKILKELIRRGKKPENMWTAGLGCGIAFYNEAGDAIEGTYLFEAMSYHFTDKYDEFNKKYNKEHPGQYLDAFTYVTGDMLYMLKECFEKEGITGDPAKLAEERKKISDYVVNRKGVKGLKYNYDIENGVGKHIPLNLFRMQKGKEVLVDTVVP